MIRGIGCDIIEIERIERSIERFGEHLLSRLFTGKERRIPLTRRDLSSFYAGRFAAKEALAKALGTGIGSRLSWHDMEILQDEIGKPIVVWNSLIPHEFGFSHTYLSISHSKSHALAYAILE